MTIITTQTTAAAPWAVIVQDRADEASMPHTRTLLPGSWDGTGSFVAVDISGEAQVVQDACTAAWSAQNIAAFKSTAPYIAAVVDPDVALQRSVLLNARRQALVSAIRSSTDAQLLAYINTNVTDLASAKVMIGNIALLIAGYIRN